MTSTRAQLDRQTACSTALHAAAAATDWILDRIDQGSTDDVVAGAYRVPYALLLTGHRAEAAQLLTWLTRHVLDEDGDLRPGPMRSAFEHRWSSYPLALLAQAAWHLERYASAETILQNLQGFQHHVDGGAFAERPDVRVTNRQDLFPTAQFGITAITLGDRAMADGAYRWLRRLYELQPELPDRLYTATDDAGLLSVADGPAADRFGLVTDFHQARQAFYNPGIAAAFLARYSARFADADAGRLAADYLTLTENGGEQQFDHTESVQVCKFAWGSAALLDLTGDERYLRHCLRMVSWFADSQHADGHWQNSPFLLPDGPTPASNLEVTAEFVQHLVVVATAIAGSSARES